MKHAHRRVAAIVVAAIAGLAAGAGSAQAATINVQCGDVAALRAAVTAANATAAPDTVVLQDVSPCTFTFANTAAQLSALPFVTQPLVIEGNGATLARSTANGTPDFRLVSAFAALEVRDTTLQGGRLTTANQAGAAIGALNAPVTLDGVVALGNAATNGVGGALAVIGSTLTVDRSTFAFNTAAQGGALSTNAATGTIRRSLLFANAGAASTGAAYVIGGPVAFENVTVSSNVSGNGTGGITVAPSGQIPGRATVASSTFADNGRTGSTAPGAALTAFAFNGPATIDVTDTIVTDTDSTAAPIVAPCAEVGGQINDGGGNLEHPGTSCGFGTTADPKLGALAANGGPTLTYRLLPGSPAIDLGGVDCPATDQRGAARPDGEACDTGAYETDPPDTTATGPQSPTNDPAVSLTSDEEAVTFECRVDGGDWGPCTSPFEPTISDGEHTVEVRAVDQDGDADASPASVTFTVDTTPPVVTIDEAPASPASDPEVTVAFSANEEPVTFECRVDDGEWAACSSPFTTTLGDGTHTIAVRAKDAAGNTGEPATTQVVVDTAPPQTTITSGPGGTIYNPYTAFSFTSSEQGSTFECRMDAGPWAACASPKTYNGLAPGRHTFSVRAIDALGNADPTPASRSFTYQRCTIRISVGLPTICI